MSACAYKLLWSLANNVFVILLSNKLFKEIIKLNLKTAQISTLKDDSGMNSFNETNNNIKKSITLNIPLHLLE